MVSKDVNHELKEIKGSDNDVNPAKYERVQLWRGQGIAEFIGVLPAEVEGYIKNGWSVRD